MSQWAHLEALAGLFLPGSSRDRFLAFSQGHLHPWLKVPSSTFVGLWLVGFSLYHITQTLTSWLPLHLS